MCRQPALPVGGVAPGCMQPVRSRSRRLPGTHFSFVDRRAITLETHPARLEEICSGHCQRRVFKPSPVSFRCESAGPCGGAWLWQPQIKRHSQRLAHPTLGLPRTDLAALTGQRGTTSGSGGSDRPGRPLPAAVPAASHFARCDGEVPRPGPNQQSSSQRATPPPLNGNALLHNNNLPPPKLLPLCVS